MGKKIGTWYYMREDTVSTKMDIYDDKIYFENYTDDLVDRAFGVLESPVNWDVFRDFLEYRCFPKSRGDCKAILKGMGLDYYDVYDIVRKTHGAMFDDTYWVKFEGEEITYKELKKSLGIWFWD